MDESFLNGRVLLHSGNCLDVLARLAECSVDSCVTDPPYGLEFMGKEWDAPWQVSSSSALFGKRQTKMPGWSVTRNPNCRRCYGRLRGPKKCQCETPAWDEAPTDTRLRQMSAFQGWCQEWAEQVYRVLKPGGHLLAMGGTRTYHRLACAIEDAGFEIRDTIAYLYGSGFPKSLAVSRNPMFCQCAAIARNGAYKGREHSQDGHNGKAAGAFGDDPPLCRECGKPIADGLGTALKPAIELCVLARKPLSEGTVAANVLRWGTGAINVDGCRVGNGADKGIWPITDRRHNDIAYTLPPTETDTTHGRWPANVAHDGSAEVTAAFPETTASPPVGSMGGGSNKHAIYGDFAGKRHENGYGNTGSAARFFYTSKADADDRLGSKHPTVKPLDLMQWLVRMVTPRGGVCLDPFSGTGTTGEAAFREGMRAVLIEAEPEYQADIRRRMALMFAGPDERSRESVKARNLPVDYGPLFGFPEAAE